MARGYEAMSSSRFWKDEKQVGMQKQLQETSVSFQNSLEEPPALACLRCCSN